MTVIMTLMFVCLLFVSHFSSIININFFSLSKETLTCLQSSNAGDLTKFYSAARCEDIQSVFTSGSDIEGSIHVSDS